MSRLFEEPKPKVYILVIAICVGLAYLFLLQEMGKLKPFQTEDYAGAYADGYQERINNEKELDCMNTGIKAITGFDPNNPVDTNVAINIYHDCLSSKGIYK